MTLELVPPAPPDRATQALERVKAVARPEGVLQCNRCGGRQTMSIRSGDRIEGGKIKAGTVIEKGICPHCWKRGITVDMIPDKPREVKPPKPRRTKPKLIK